MCNTVELATIFLGNYPKHAAANRKRGVFSFRVIAEPDGTVPCCLIAARTKAGDLDPRCKDIVRIAKFDPATDAQGNPMWSFFAATAAYLAP